MSDSARVSLSVRDDVARITLSGSVDSCAIDLQFAREFLHVVSSVEDSAARAIVLVADRPHFCFGGDLKAMAAAGDQLPNLLQDLATNLHAGICRLANGKIPVITGVVGVAAGAGFGLVLASDIVIAGRSAKFSPAYGAVGLTPDAGCSYFLPRIIGRTRTIELLLLNRVLDAATALDWGIVNSVVDDDTVSLRTAETAARIAQGPKRAYESMKRLIMAADLECHLEKESECIVQQGGLRESHEGIRAFIEKRPANFKAI